jgi:hypothetical protein
MILTAAELAGVGAIATAIGAAVGAVANAWVQGRKSADRVAVAMGRESTGQQRLAAAQDRGAFERAFEIKADEHRECIDEVKGLREEVVRNRDEIANVRVALAHCEEQHVHSASERERDRAEHRAEMERVKRDIARIDKKTTPPEGTPMVSKE